MGELRAGHCGTIKAITNLDDSESNSHDIDDRLRELGFDEGLPFTILQESLFGRDPIAVQIGQMTVALRRQQANCILVALD